MRRLNAFNVPRVYVAPNVYILHVIIIIGDSRGGGGGFKWCITEFGVCGLCLMAFVAVDAFDGAQFHKCHAATYIYHITH